MQADEATGVGGAPSPRRRWRWRRRSTAVGSCRVGGRAIGRPAAKGGTYRVGWDSTSAGPTASTRPASTSANALAIYYEPARSARSSGYNHVGGAAGQRARARPRDGRSPKPTNGGKTYTFTLKDGIKFGPPVNREITSKDIKYALERIGRPEERRPSTPFYYTRRSRASTTYGKGKAKTISGIKTPTTRRSSST